MDQRPLPRVGDILLDRYRIVGQRPGSFGGAVYWAEDQSGGTGERKTASRLINLWPDPGLHQRDTWRGFVSDINRLMAYPQGHLAVVEALVVDHLHRCLQIQLVPCLPSLEQDLQKGGRFSLADGLLLVVAVGRALAHAHGLGVVQLNLTTEQVLVDRVGLHGGAGIYVTGMACWRLVPVDPEPEQRGTPAGVAPEVRLGGEAGGLSADVYSLAYLTYRTLNGGHPFDESEGKAASSDGRGAYRSLRGDQPAIPPALDRVLARGLALEPAARYPSVQRFCDELVEALAGSLDARIVDKLRAPEALRPSERDAEGIRPIVIVAQDGDVDAAVDDGLEGDNCPDINRSRDLVVPRVTKPLCRVHGPFVLVWSRAGRQLGARPITARQLTIGWDRRNEIVLTSDHVSARHARLSLEPTGVYLEDLGSTNGTVFGGQRIGSPVALDIEDQFEVADVVFTLKKLARSSHQLRHETEKSAVNSKTSDRRPPEVCLTSSEDGQREKAAKMPGFSKPQQMAGEESGLAPPEGIPPDRGGEMAALAATGEGSVDIVPPGPTVRHTTLTVEDLIQRGSLSPQMAAFLRLCVTAGRNILISGEPGSGRTTALATLCQALGQGEPLVTVELEPKLLLYREKWTPLNASGTRTAARAETLRGLVRLGAGMAPRRLALAACSGIETAALMQAMEAGIPCISTISAEHPPAAAANFTALVAAANGEVRPSSSCQRLAASRCVLVHLLRLAPDVHRVSWIGEVSGVEADHVTLQGIFSWRPPAGDNDPTDRFVPVGFVPAFCRKLRHEGHPVDLTMFTPRPRPASTRRGQSGR